MCCPWVSRFVTAMKRCTHNMRRLYRRPQSAEEHVAYMLARYDHYWHCVRCGRIGFISERGNLRWLKREGVAQRFSHAEEWNQRMLARECMEC